MRIFKLNAALFALCVSVSTFTINASTPEGPEEYDYVIVGGGSAGCTLAGKLIENIKYFEEITTPIKILLLEAGENNNVDNIKDHAQSGLLTHTKHDWSDLTFPQKYLNGRAISYNTGKVMGGGSSINGMLWAHGHKEDYNSWVSSSEDTNASEWRGDKVYETFKALELKVQSYEEDQPLIYPGEKVEKAERGLGLSRLIYPLGKCFLEVADKLGYPSEKKQKDDSSFEEDENYLNSLAQGAYYPIFNVVKGTNPKYLRQDAFTCFLKSYEGSEGEEESNAKYTLKILYQARVDKLSFTNENNNTIDYVSYLHKNTYGSVKVNREVILCAGAIRTPQILMLSGIGDENHLKKHGIQPKRILPHVGKNLQEHLSTAIVRKLNPEKLKEVYQENRNKLSTAFTAFENEEETTGPEEAETLTMAPQHQNTTIFTIFFEPGINKKIRKIQKIQQEKPSSSSDVQEQSSSSSGAPKYTDPIKELRQCRPSFQLQSFFVPGHITHGTSYFGLAVIQLRPLSRGSILLKSDYFLDDPQINLNLLSHSIDRKAQLVALKEARELMDAFANDEDNLENTWVEEEVYPGHLTTDEQLKGYIRALSYPYMHPAGTCRMGNRDEKSVVGYDLKVWGINNLRIADASIMPSLISANTNATAMMIGAKCAGFVFNTLKENLN